MKNFDVSISTYLLGHLSPFIPSGTYIRLPEFVSWLIVALFNFFRPVVFHFGITVSSSSIIFSATSNLMLILSSVFFVSDTFIFSMCLLSM